MCVEKRVRRAGITIEVLLASALAVVVLFMVLGLFSNNLKMMIASSNFNNIFNKKSATEYEKESLKDYAHSQVTVQVVAEQSLEQIHQDAKIKIDDYMKSTTPLTDSQIVDLARLLTVYANSDAQMYPRDFTSSSSESIFNSAHKTSYGAIYISLSSFTTSFTANGKRNDIDWQNQYSNFTLYSTSEKDRKLNITAINTIFANYK